MIEWGRKQYKLIDVTKHPGHTYLIHGPVRSGKTMPAVFGFCGFACEMFSGHDFLIASRSETQLESIIITYMREFAYEHGMLLKRRGKHYVLDSFIGSEPNRFWPFIGNDKSAAYKVSGTTMAGAILDECELMPYAFVNVCRERLGTTTGRKAFLITNPGGPNHWYKTDLIDKADGNNVVDMPFTMYDNPTMTKEQVDYLSQTQQSGVMRERRIHGKWVAATGMVYPDFRNAIKARPNAKPDVVVLSIDHAESSITHALRFEIYSKPYGIWCAREWWHDHREGRLDDTAQCIAILNALNGDGRVDRIYIDPAALRFATKMREMVSVDVHPAENDVAEGIQKTGQWMAEGIVYISPHCEKLIEELDGYVWDEDAAEKGEDKPVKKNDHGADAFRYYCYSDSRRLADIAMGDKVIDVAAY